MHRIGDEPADIVEPERRQHNLIDWRSSFADRLQRPHKRVRRANLVIPVGSDKQHVSYLRMRNQTLKEVERCCIQPLQIIKKEGERMFWPGECSEETPEHQLETVLRILRRQVRNGRLFANDEFQLWAEVNDQLAICAQSLLNSAPPLFHFGVALDEDLTDQRLKGLCQGSVWDFPPVLVELARREQPANRNNRLVQLVHHGRFANTGITRYEHKLKRTLSHPVEGRKQGVDLPLPPVQLLRDQQLV